MVNPEAIDLALPHEFEHQLVRGVEDGLVLDTEGGKIVDVEEASIVDLVCGDSPVREPIRLLLEELVQRVEAGGLPLVPRETPHGRLNRKGDSVILCAESGEPALVVLLVAMPFRDLLRCGGDAVGEGTESAPQHLDRCIGNVGQRAVEHSGISPGIQGKPVFMIEKRERAQVRLEPQLYLAPLQHHAVRISQPGHEDFVREHGVGGSPVDIEVFGVSGRLAVLQHIHPPEIVRTHDADVVRDDVEDVPHLVGAQRCDKLLEVLATPDFRIEGVVIDHVVAMDAPGSRAEVGRAIGVADTKRSEIGDDGRCVTKRESRVELDAVRGARNCAGRAFSPRQVPAPAAR